VAGSLLLATVAALMSPNILFAVGAFILTFLGSLLVSIK
jgi:hypothetical protein